MTEIPHPDSVELFRLRQETLEVLLTLKRDMKIQQERMDYLEERYQQLSTVFDHFTKNLGAKRD